MPHWQRLVRQAMRLQIGFYIFTIHRAGTDDKVIFKIIGSQPSFDCSPAMVRPAYY
jgi:hypothetical protein